MGENPSCAVRDPAPVRPERVHAGATARHAGQERTKNPSSTSGGARCVLLLDPDLGTRTLIHRALEENLSVRSVTSVAAAADIPVGVLEVPLTVIISSGVTPRDVAPLMDLLIRPDTRVVLVVRAHARKHFEDLVGFPVDAVIRMEDLRGPAATEVLTYCGHDTVAISRHAMRQLLHMIGTSPALVPAAPSLTAREAETLHGMAEGLSNRQIARDMGISEHGVKRHVAHILAKLGCRNRTTAVAVALRTGLVPQSPSKAS